MMFKYVVTVVSQEERLWVGVKKYLRRK